MRISLGGIDYAILAGYFLFVVAVGWFARRRVRTSAQNLWMAIFAWSACFLVTLLVSLSTAPRPAAEWHGLVYSLTPRVADSQEPWHRRPPRLWR